MGRFLIVGGFGPLYVYSLQFHLKVKEHAKKT